MADEILQEDHDSNEGLEKIKKNDIFYLDFALLEFFSDFIFNKKTVDDLTDSLKDLCLKLLDNKKDKDNQDIKKLINCFDGKLINSDSLIKTLYLNLCDCLEGIEGIDKKDSPESICLRIIVRFAELCDLKTGLPASFSVLEWENKLKKITPEKIEELTNDIKNYYYKTNIKDYQLQLRYFLYKHPLFCKYNEKSKFKKKLKIAIIGFGNYSQAFLDLCLEYSQNLDLDFLEVEIYSDNIDERFNQYKNFRPLLNEFFQITIKNNAWPSTDDNSNDKNIHYGEINLFDKTLDNSEYDIDFKDFSYIFISTGKNKDNRELAKTINEKSPEVPVSFTDGIKIKYNSELKKVLKENEEYLFRLNPNDDSFIHDVEFKNLERMAFNTHIVYSGGLNNDLNILKNGFYERYNYLSCLSFVLSLKYKLFNYGYEIDDESIFSSESFEPCIKKQSNFLAWAEHKRWNVEKICQGWQRLSIEECIALSSNKDSINKKHLCLVTSKKGDNSLKVVLEKEANRYDRFYRKDNKTFKKINNLDELDEVSFELHKKCYEEILYSNKREVCKQLLNDIYITMPKEEVLEIAYKRWEAAIFDIFDVNNINKNCLSIYNLYRNEFINIVSNVYKKNKECINNLVIKFEQNFWVYIQYKKWVIYKDLDYGFMDHILFIVGYEYIKSVNLEFENFKDMEKKLFKIGFDREFNTNSSTQQKGPNPIKVKKNHNFKWCINELPSKLKYCINSKEVYFNYAIQDWLKLIKANTDTYKLPAYYDNYKNLWDIFIKDPKKWNGFAGIIGQKNLSYLGKISKKDITTKSEDIAYQLPDYTISGALYLLETLKKTKKEADKNTFLIDDYKCCYNGVYGIKIEIKKCYISKECLKKLFINNTLCLVDKKLIYCCPDEKFNIDKDFRIEKEVWNGDKKNKNKFIREKNLDIYNNEEHKKILKKHINWELNENTIVSFYAQNFELSNEKFSQYEDIIKDFEKAGYIYKIAGKLQFSSMDSKLLFSTEGQIVEIYTYQKLKESCLFNDVVSGNQIYYKKNCPPNELDCAVTKNNRLCLIECKLNYEDIDGNYVDKEGNKQWRFYYAYQQILSHVNRFESDNVFGVLLIYSKDKDLDDLCGYYENDKIYVAKLYENNIISYKDKGSYKDSSLKLSLENYIDRLFDPRPYINGNIKKKCIENEVVKYIVANEFFFDNDGNKCLKETELENYIKSFNKIIQLRYDKYKFDTYKINSNSNEIINFTQEIFKVYNRIKNYQKVQNYNSKSKLQNSPKYYVQIEWLNNSNEEDFKKERELLNDFISDPKSKNLISNDCIDEKKVLVFDSSVFSSWFNNSKKYTKKYFGIDAKSKLTMPKYLLKRHIIFKKSKEVKKNKSKYNNNNSDNHKYNNCNNKQSDSDKQNLPKYYIEIEWLNASNEDGCEKERKLLNDFITENKAEAPIRKFKKNNKDVWLFDDVTFSSWFNNCLKYTKEDFINEFNKKNKLTMLRYLVDKKILVKYI